MLKQLFAYLGTIALILLLIVGPVLFSGCFQQPNKVEAQDVEKSSMITLEEFKNGDRIVRIDGCKYIFTYGGLSEPHHYYHMPSCDNPIHKEKNR